MHLLWLLTLRGGRGHWEERQGSCAGSFHYGYESVRPAISVCQQNVWRGLFWNCVYVNAFTQSPGQVSLPSRSGLACRRGLWKVIRSDFSRAKKLPAKSGWYTLSTAQRRAPSACEPLPHRALAARPVEKRRFVGITGSPPQRGCTRFNPG